MKKGDYAGNKKRRVLVLAVLIIALSAVLIVSDLAFLQPKHQHSSSTSSTSSSSSTYSSSSSVSTSSSSLSSSSSSSSPSSSITQVGKLSAAYITSSAPNSSQWLVVKSVSSPISIFANDTGSIQEYRSLSLLNETKIGVYCNSVNSNGACSAFEMYEETGWYWDSTNQILYIHYVGGKAVNITIFVSNS